MSLGSTLSFDPHRHQCVLEIHHLKMLDVCGFCEKKKKRRRKKELQFHVPSFYLLKSKVKSAQ